MMTKDIVVGDHAEESGRSRRCMRSAVVISHRGKGTMVGFISLRDLLEVEDEATGAGPF